MSRQAILLGALIPGYFLYRKQLYITQLGNNIYISQEKLQQLQQNNVVIGDDKQVLINNRINAYKLKKRVVIVGATLAGLIQAQILLQSPDFEVVIIDSQDPFDKTPLEAQQKIDLSFENLMNSSFPMIYLFNLLISKMQKQQNLYKDEIPKNLPQEVVPLYSHLLISLYQTYPNTFSLQKNTVFEKFVFSNKIEGVYTNGGYIQSDFVVICESVNKSMKMLGLRIPVLESIYKNRKIGQTFDNLPYVGKVNKQVWINAVYEGQETDLGFTIGQKIMKDITHNQTQNYDFDINRIWLA